MLKTVLLTTDTPHHRHYSQRIDTVFPWHTVYLETKKVSTPFDTHHEFEKVRERYEHGIYSSGSDKPFSKTAPILRCESVNTDPILSDLRALAPDIIIIFGTGKVCSSIISSAMTACLNLHGGNPEQYRGLDTHLWAIYHNDFNNLVTTLHYANNSLDDGDIIFQSQLPLSPETKLHKLRAVNTEVCIDLSLLALSLAHREKPIPSRKQIIRGRYYSAMPGVLKETCVRNFEKHVRIL